MPKKGKTMLDERDPIQKDVHSQAAPSNTSRPSGHFSPKGPYRKSTLIGCLVLFASISAYLLIHSFAGNQNLAAVPLIDKPERGIVWAGLKSARAGSVCGRLYEVVDPNGRIAQCTHGPDPAPEGVDIRRSVEPVKTGEKDRTAQTATGTSTTAAASLISCDGDGQTGQRVQALYVRAADVPSRFATYAASFQTWAGNVNNIFVESGLQTGSARSLRWVHDTNCNVVVAEVVIPTTGDDNFSNTRTELQKLGYNRSDRKYLLWVDAAVYCGIGTLWGDDQASSSNINNGGPSYARADSGCWNYAEAHELMHNLGGVQQSAPHATAGWHCTDEYDEECYADASGVVMTYPCPSTQARMFDCNKDDYFYAGTPPNGSYLASHWNTANSSYLIVGQGSPTPTPVQCGNSIDDDGDGKIDYPADPGCSSLTDDTESPDPVVPPPTDTVAPVATISSPKNGATVTKTVQIRAAGTDNVAVTKMELFLDGVLKNTTTTGSISYKWSTSSASRGTHTITAKVYDKVGNIGQASITVNR